MDINDYGGGRSSGEEDQVNSCQPTFSIIGAVQRYFSYHKVRYFLYRDCYGRFALFWPMGKLKFQFSLSVSTQFDFYQHQSGEHVES